METIIPAVCTNPACNTLFFSKNAFGAPVGGTISLTGCGLGPCPKCGSGGRVPDGKYRNEGSLTRFFPKSQFELQQLSLALRIIHSGLSRGDSSDKIEKELEDKALAASSVWSYLPTPKDNPIAFWTLVCTIIMTILNSMGAFSDSPDVINNEYHFYSPDSLEGFDGALPNTDKRRLKGQSNTCYPEENRSS